MDFDNTTPSGLRTGLVVDQMTGNLDSPISRLFACYRGRDASIEMRSLMHEHPKQVCSVLTYIMNTFDKPWMITGVNNGLFRGGYFITKSLQRYIDCESRIGATVLDNLDVLPRCQFPCSFHVTGRASNPRFMETCLAFVRYYHNHVDADHAPKFTTGDACSVNHICLGIDDYRLGKGVVLSLGVNDACQDDDHTPSTMVHMNNMAKGLVESGIPRLHVKYGFDETRQCACYRSVLPETDEYVTADVRAPVIPMVAQIEELIVRTTLKRRLEAETRTAKRVRLNNNNNSLCTLLSVLLDK